MLRLSVVLATAVALAAASSASAAAPVRFTDAFQNSDTINCSQFNPAWKFNDNFTDFFTVRGQDTFNAAGVLVSSLQHVEHVSNDVNSVTGFTIHEHNHVTLKFDFLRNTLSLSGAIGIAQRPGFGSVIHTAG